MDSLRAPAPSQPASTASIAERPTRAGAASFLQGLRCTDGMTPGAAACPAADSPQRSGAWSSEAPNPARAACGVDSCHPLESLLRSLATRLLSARHAVAVREIERGGGADQRSPLPAELAGAGERRRAAFLAGRAGAHAALRALGSHAPAIPMGPAGAPVWPNGFVGSISHTDRLAAAVVATDPPVAGLGLDIEDDLPLDEAEMVGLVCRADELADALRPSAPEHLLRGKLLFVIKEAVYKLHRPLGGAFLDFHDVRVTLDTSAGRFRAELIHARQQGGAGAVIRGGFARANGSLAALAVAGR